MAAQEYQNGDKITLQIRRSCFYRCTFHSVVYLINIPTNAHVHVI